ncbi:MAG: hypothetical protein NC926_02960 [Candidatus Omnitrophica bacterium]|nr:hypothetical protein [Candidatus Omnitrophota bacterium]
MLKKLLIFFSILILSIEAKIQVKNGNTEIIFDKKTGEIINIYFLGKKFLKENGYFCIYDKEKDIILKKGRVIKERKDGFLWQSEDETIELDNSFEKINNLIIWNIYIKNLEDKEKRIEIGINLPLIEGRWKFFDGRYEHLEIKNEIKRDDINSTFPLSCVYDENSGVAIGITPEQLISYLCSKFDKNKNFQYSTRLYLKSRDKEKIRFLIFACESDFGWRNFIQKYYDTFSEFFIHNKEIDPKIVEGVDTAGFPFGYYYSGMSPEILRRIRATTCWCYGPWKREGDWYCRDEYWDYKPANEEVAKKSIQWQKTAEEYRKYREERFKLVKEYDVGGCFYIWNGCESSLADEKFPESKITDKPSFMSYYYETAYWMFPYGGKFGEFFEDGLKRIFKEIDGVTGIAYDSSGGMGNRKYYGKLIEILDLPKAWDEKGIYILEGVGIAKNFDFIHSLRTKDGKYKVGIWINPGGEHPIPYMIVFRSDRGMIEWRWINTYDKNIKELLDIYRLLMGKKVLSMHSTLRGDKFAERINWRDFKKEEILDTYRGLWKHMIIGCLYWGILPYPDLIRGIPEMFEILPLLIEIKDTGWEPLTGCKGPENLLISRFGKKVKYFTFSNSTKDRINGKVEILGKYFEGFSPILTNWFGKEYIFDINKNTIFDIEILPREFLVFKSICGYKGDGIRVKTKEIKRADSIELILELLDVKGRNHKFILYQPDGYELNEIKINEKKINLRDLNYGIKPKVNDIVKIKFVSEVIKSREEEILNFPYDKSVIFVERGLKNFAERIVEYFRFWYKYGSEYRKELIIPVKNIEDEKIENEYKIIIKEDKIPEIRIEGNSLIIKGTNEELKETIKKLLYLLDKKYVYYGKFHVADTLWYYWDEPREKNLETIEMLKYIGVYDSTFSLGEIKK